MTIAVVARVAVKPGRSAEFEEAFRSQAEQVSAKEPANRLYRLFRSRTDPGAYTVLEIYADDAALAAHMASDHMRANRAVMASLLDGRASFEIVDGVSAATGEI
jgi:Uncharacterized conserved protein